MAVAKAEKQKLLVSLGIVLLAKEWVRNVTEELELEMRNQISTL